MNDDDRSARAMPCHADAMAGDDCAEPPSEQTAAEQLSQEDARRVLARLDIVTNILRGWIWETDEKHRFVYMSDSVKRYAGRTPEWHYGKTRQELGNLNPNIEAHKRFLRQLEAREMFGPIDFVRYENGSQFWMRTIGLPQVNEAGKFTGYCGVAFDVTNSVDTRQGNRRLEERRRVARSATIMSPELDSAIPCVVLDISSSGARLDVHQHAKVPRRFMLSIELEGAERTCEVAWRDDTSIGVRFIDKRLT